jgi:hypothetical protein
MTLNTILLTVVLLLAQATVAQQESSISGSVTYADGTPYARARIFVQPASESGSDGDSTISPLTQEGSSP